MTGTSAQGTEALAESQRKTATARHGLVILTYVGGPYRLYTVAAAHSDGREVDALTYRGLTYGEARAKGNELWAALNTHTIQQLLDALPCNRSVPAPRLAPPAKGTALHVSDPGHRVLAACATLGWVKRGGGAHEATIKQIDALARRGYLTRTYVYEGRRRVVTGATITDSGRRRLAELDAAVKNSPMTIA